MIKLGKLENRRKTLKEICKGLVVLWTHVAINIKKFDNK